MPTPHSGEKEQDFISRCIPVVLDDGTAESNDQAVAICYSMWEEAMDKSELYTLARDAIGLARSVINDGKMMTALAEAKDTDTRTLANTMIDELEAKLTEQENGEREKAQMAKEERAQRYGISAVDGKAVTKPSEFSNIPDDDFGDPVNYAYPADEEHARAALGYFNHETARADGGYSEADWSKVGARLAKLVSKYLEADYEFSDGKLAQKASEVQPLTSVDVLNLLAELDEMRERLQKFVTVPDSVSELAESSTGIISLSEDGSQPAENGARAPLRVEFALIRPGFGNKRDNNYYPAEMLRRDAHVFEGVKMYTTDHRPGEKSERTEVAVVEKMPVRFLDDGTPVGVAAIFDPDFAEKTRNRAAQGHLATLENSILGKGRTKAGMIGEKKANIVEALTEGVSVDWVTKAGAGGRALNLAESEQEPVEEVNDMENEQEQVGEQETEQEPQGEQPQAPVEEVWLSEDDVSSILEGAKLPESAKARLSDGKYQDQDALKEAVQAEVDYIKELTGAGQPVMPQGKTQAKAAVTLVEREATMSAVNSKWLGSRARKE